MPFELVNATNQPAIIKVIGVGGGGGNAVMHMLGSNIESGEPPPPTPITLIIARLVSGSFLDL